MNSSSIKAYWVRNHATNHSFSDAYWEFRWEQEIIEAGKSRINWWLEPGQDEGSNGLASQIKLSINGNQVVFLEDTYGYYYRFSNPHTLETYKGVNRYASGSFEIEHDLNGDASFSVGMEGRIYYNSNPLDQTNAIFNLDKNYPYSYIGQPTNINITPKIVTPGGHMTITWDSAANGIANPVASYQIWYRARDWGDNGWVWQRVSADQNSFNFQLPDDTARGQVIDIAIQADPTIAGYGSAQVWLGNVAKVNWRPSKPDVNWIDPSNQILPSTGGSPVFNLSPGVTGDIEQTASLYYSLSPDGEKFPCSTTFVGDFIDQNNNKEGLSYYFYTYDGVEFSESTEEYRITLNTKPEVSFTFEGDKSSDSYLSFILNNGQLPENSLNEISIACTCKGVHFQIDKYIWESAARYNIGDIREKLSSYVEFEEGEIAEVQFDCTRFDGIEYSEQFIVNGINLKIPEITFKNDNGEEERFSKQLKIALSSDGEGNYSKVSVNENLWAEANDDKEFLLNTSSLPYGQEIKQLTFNNNIKINLSDSCSKVDEIDIIPPIGSESPFDVLNFQVYTDSSLQVTLRAMTGEQYGVGINFPSLELAYGDNYESTLEVEPNESSSDNTWIYQFSGKELWNKFFKKDNETNEKLSVSIRFGIINEFGDKFTKIFNLNLDYTQEAIVYKGDLNTGELNLAPSLYTPIEDQVYELNKWVFLKESMPIYCSFSVLAFDQPYLILEQLDNNGKWFEIYTSSLSECIEDLNINNYGDFIFNTSPKCYYINSKKIMEIEEILSNYNTNFRARVQTVNHEINYVFYSNPILVQSHFAPIARFTQATFTSGQVPEENLLQANLEIENPGFYDVDGIIETVAIKILEINEIVEEIDYSGQSCEWVGFNRFGSNEFLHIAPFLTTSLGTRLKTNNDINRYFITTKNSFQFSNVVVYNTIPTISYRKNHLGINTLTPSAQENAIVTIGAYNNRNVIYLMSDQHTAEINLQSGALNSFIIDAGSWDNTPGGIIPINPDIPTNLARIAYTGEIGDLEQDRADIIIFTGGSALDEI